MFDCVTSQNLAGVYFFFQCHVRRANATFTKSYRIILKTTLFGLENGGERGRAAGEAEETVTCKVNCSPMSFIKFSQQHGGYIYIYQGSLNLRPFRQIPFKERIKGNKGRLI